MAKVLKMQFTMSDDVTVLTVSLPSPRVDVSADDVRGFMNTCINKDAIEYKGLSLKAAKSAVVVETNDEVIF